MGSGRRKTETQDPNKRRERLKILNDDFFVGARKTITEAGRDRRDKNSGQISSYESLGRQNDGAARARDVNAAQFTEQTKVRRLTEKMAVEPKLCISGKRQVSKA